MDAAAQTPNTKLSIVANNKEMMVYGPSDWCKLVKEGITYLEVRTIEGKVMCWNVNKISNIREVADIEFNNFMTRVALINKARQDAQKERQEKELMERQAKALAEATPAVSTGPKLEVTE